jgi:hypothetical protein
MKREALKTNLPRRRRLHSLEGLAEQGAKAVT